MRTIWIVVGTIVLAIVVAIFIWTADGRGRVEISTPLGIKLDMQGPQPSGSITGKDLQAGHDIEAELNTGGDLNIENATADGDISLRNTSPEESADPKP